MLRGGRKMKTENKFLKILVIILTIINLFICLKSMRLEIEYNKLNKKNEELKILLMEDMENERTKNT
mgnify:CR=1 FL=1